MSFSYENQNLRELKEPKELNTYDRICLDRLYVFRPFNENKFKDYNLIKSCDLNKQRALV
jgi:hypothetical protein